MKLFTSDEIRRVENNLILSGVSVDTLIERAGKGLADAVGDARRVAVVVGGGNNGADGISATFNLIDRKILVDVYTLGDIKSEYTISNLPRLKSMGVTVVDLDECESLGGYDIVIDCIFGIGLSRAVEGIYAIGINRINSESKRVISADIPSGVSADTGRVLSHAVVADITVSFSGGKVGYFLSDAIDHVGDIVYVDTDIFGEIAVAQLIDSVTFSKRRKNTHKGNYGRVSIISGCPNYVGAGILASTSAKASMRAGAGLVKQVVPYSMRETYASHALEQTLDFLTDSQGWIVFDKDKLDDIIANSTVIAIGMGLGNTHEVQKTVDYLIQNAPSLVLDADALNAIVGRLDVLKKGRRVVITPHLGEFSRLIGKPIKDIDLIEDARAFATTYGVTVHLKSATSITVDESGAVQITANGTPALAKGGSGDVLSGVIASFVAQNIPNAVASASFIHGEAGRLASVKFGEYGVLAGDLPDKIAQAILKYTV